MEDDRVWLECKGTRHQWSGPEAKAGSTRLRGQCLDGKVTSCREEVSKEREVRELLPDTLHSPADNGRRGREKENATDANEKLRKKTLMEDRSTKNRKSLR